MTSNAMINRAAQSHLPLFPGQIPFHPLPLRQVPLHQVPFHQLPFQSDTYHEFSQVLDTSIYAPLPDDWLIGITDIVDSTVAIRAGRYEDVNYAGASIIAALGNEWGSNEWGRFDFPFVFRGDGAGFAVPPEAAEAAVAALRQVARFARETLGLTLRIGLLSVREIRAHGRDVTLARYAASAKASYAMFAGGGLKWAEQELKQGRYLVTPGSDAAMPDLTGLACEWLPFASEQGQILSLLVEPAEQTTPEIFASLARRVLAVFDTAQGASGHGASHPLPTEIATPKDRAKQVTASRWKEVAAQSDFRKYDDVLRLTLDCTAAQIDAVEAMLVAAKAQGLINFGLHRQSHALMTCLVPSGSPQTDLHFLDGAGGGYAKAAEMLEAGTVQDMAA